jgi:hypothetical protein
VLALNKRDVAVCSVCKVSAHDKHLRIFDDITRERAVRCPRAWLVRIPFDPFKSRHGEHIYVVESLAFSEYKLRGREHCFTVAFSPKPNPPYM